MCKNSRMEVEEEESKEEFTMNSPRESFDSLKIKVYRDGNERAYMKLFYLIYDTRHLQDLLPYSLVMANKFNSPVGTVHVFYDLTHSYANRIEDIDSITSNLAIEYLFKAAKMKNESAIDIIKMYSIEYNPKTNRDQIIKMYSHWKKKDTK